MNALPDPTLRHALKQLSEQWRARADRVQTIYRGVQPQAAKASAAALETCAEELDEMLEREAQSEAPPCQPFAAIGLATS